MFVPSSERFLMSPDPSVREADRVKAREICHSIACLEDGNAVDLSLSAENIICDALASTRQAAEEGQR